MSPGHDKAVSPEFFLEDRPTLLKVGSLTGGSREEIAREIGRRARGLMERRLERTYVADFTPLRVDQPADDLQYVMIWRRIDDGVDPDAAWADLSRRVQEFRQGIP